VRAEPQALTTIAERSRGTPRIANRFLRRVRDLAQVRRRAARRPRARADALARLGVDEHGLEELDRRILRCLAQTRREPVGIKTIAAAVGETEDTIEEVFEPHLLRIGFLQKTARGRTITESGCRAIGVDSAQHGSRRGAPALRVRHALAALALALAAAASPSRRRRRNPPRPRPRARAAAPAREMPPAAAKPALAPRPRAELARGRSGARAPGSGGPQRARRGRRRPRAASSR
jgi:hypothetical protein